jgi:hypothetical protein
MRPKGSHAPQRTRRRRRSEARQFAETLRRALGGNVGALTDLGYYFHEGEGVSRQDDAAVQC